MYCSQAEIIYHIQPTTKYFIKRGLRDVPRFMQETEVLLSHITNTRLFCHAIHQESWRYVLERRGMKVNRRKTKYM